MGGSTMKVAIAALVSILLMVATEAADTNNKPAVDKLCSSTDYQQICQQSMANANSSNPKSLVQTALDFTISSLGNTLRDSDVIKKASTDPSTKAAFDICDEVLDRAVGDLKRSVLLIAEMDNIKISDVVEDLRVWLSAVITFEETCLDAFDNTTGETAARMKYLLKTSRQLSSNGLALADGIQDILGQLNLGDLALSLSGGSSARKLLWYDRREMAEIKPNAIVALDGSGQFKSINDAIQTVPVQNKQPFVILVKAGVYKEYVEIPKKKDFITLIGEGPLKTRIIGNKNFVDGVKTYATATVAVNAEDFIAKDIAFENSAGPDKHQAVALRVSGDRAIFHNVHIDAYQDSLYTHTYRQFYRFCRISGTVDFVFGDSLAIFQKCEFVVRKPMDNQACMVTAQGRTDKRSQGAIVIQGSTISAEQAFLDTQPPLKAYLGRPWKELSRTIIMNTNIGGFIVPEGWSEWNGDFALDTLFYVEYQNTGPGANQAQRVKWKGMKQFTPKEAAEWGAAAQYLGDEWIRSSGVPYWPDINFN